MDIKVSIIIPVYNVAPYLNACLSSCVNQTFRDIEIIVVDDGSTDESSDIIKRYAETDERVVVITKENQGLIYARKSGLDIAKGQYVFHLDGDDFIETNAIEKLYDKVIEQQADYIVANFYDVSGNERYEVLRNSRFKGLSGQDLFLCMLRGGYEVWGRLIRKTLYDGVIYKPIVMGEDLFVTMQIVPKVKKAVCVDDCLYNYVRRANSITNGQESIALERNIYMLMSVLSLLDIYPYTQLVRERICLMFFPFYLSCISKRKMEVRTLLYDYYWTQKDVKIILWKKRKDFYLILSIFFRSPALASLFARVYLHMIPLCIKLLKGLKIFNYIQR